MFPGAAEVLICPHCRAPLRPEGTAFRCKGGHAFDLAKQGYLNLLPGGGPAHTGDDAEMVAARAKFQGDGHLGWLAGAVAERAVELIGDGPGCVVDVGAGTGYYLARVLERIPRRAGLALDVSKFALRRAARAHERIGAVACDVWRAIPIRDEAAVLVLNVFAPRNGAEIGRILHHSGALVVVTPTPRHLVELVEPLGLLSVDEDKDARLARDLEGPFRRSDRDILETSLELAAGDIEAAALMGPSARHTDRTTLARSIAQLPATLGVTGSVAVTVYRCDRPEPLRS